MKTIITELTANNQVAIRYVNRPNCLKGQQLGDGASIRQDETIARYQRYVEDIDRAMSRASTVYEHDNSKTQPVKLDMRRHFEEGEQRGEIFSMSRYKGQACIIPENVTVKKVNRSGVEVVGMSCSELSAQRRLYLDIIKKSQQGAKPPRPWGAYQTPKRFTRNAKQKILESGAVIDRHVGVEKSFEVTVTIPGSGFDVYDVVSRYSGYIVNRLTQIIRRLEAKGLEVFWFFVWEHQKRGALHMHWCIACKSGVEIARDIAECIREKWFELLEELSQKTGVDLFKKKGFLGTWRNSPEKWQSNVAVVRKSVAAYFSKYCSKNASTQEYNRARRQAKKRLSSWHPPQVYKHGVISLYPSRYWGSSSSVKRLCKRYRVTVSFAVASPKEGHHIYKAIRGWVSDLCHKFAEVSRTFKKIDPQTDFIYAQGWERKIWFDEKAMTAVLKMFRDLQGDSMRKTDAIGAIASMQNAHIKSELNYMSALEEEWEDFRYAFVS